ncbi:hypothetical protein [Salinicola socius]|uniref:hypothetical protein n=1 Tax=Salinicola socius TaxID=404433 RepID=UPI000DA1EE30|nr:hypothetical protein [Salinicola socius]
MSSAQLHKGYSVSESEPFEDHWYYQGRRKINGPFNKEAMIVAIMDQDVDSDTQVWNTSWTENAPTQALRETELGGYLTDEAREKYTPTPVSDRLAWVLALFPLAFLFIDSVLIYNYNPIAFSNGYMLAVPLVYSLIALVDALSIRDSGRSRAPLYWFWMIPVYLAVRANKLRRGGIYFWLWLLSTVLYLIVVYGVVDGGYFMPSTRPLPSCSNSMIIDTNKELFDDAVAENRRSPNSLARSIQNALGTDYGNPYYDIGYNGFRQSPKANDIVEIAQITETQETRSCQAVVIASRGPRIPIDYSITRRSGGIEVTMQSR